MDRSWLYPMIRRVQSAVLLKVLLFISDRTDSWPDSPEFANITMGEFQQLIGVSERAIEIQIAAGEELGWISRERPNLRHNRGGYRIHPERFAETPIPAMRTRECAPRSAAVTAPPAIEPLRATAAAAPVANPVSPLITIEPAAKCQVAGDTPAQPLSPPVCPVANPVSLDEPGEEPNADSDESQYVTVRVHRSAFHPETGCAPGGCLIKQLISNQASKQNGACAQRTKRNPDEYERLSRWVSRQPYGRVDALTRRGLSEAECNSVFAELDNRGITLDTFFHLVRDVVIGAHIEKPAALLLAFIRDGFPAEKRRNDRLMSAAEIHLPPIPE